MIVKIPEKQVIKLTMKERYSIHLPKGAIVEVDAIKRADSATNYMGRVINYYKKPLWLDMGWFTEFKRKIIKKNKKD